MHSLLGALSCSFPSPGVDDPHQHGRGVALADFNRDGKVDIVYGNWNGPHRLYLQMSTHGKVRFRVRSTLPPPLGHPVSCPDLLHPTCAFHTSGLWLCRARGVGTQLGGVIWRTVLVVEYRTGVLLAVQRQDSPSALKLLPLLELPAIQCLPCARNCAKPGTVFHVCVTPGGQRGNPRDTVQSSSKKELEIPKSLFPSF